MRNCGSTSPNPQRSLFRSRPLDGSLHFSLSYTLRSVPHSLICRRVGGWVIRRGDHCLLKTGILKNSE